VLVKKMNEDDIELPLRATEMILRRRVFLSTLIIDQPIGNEDFDGLKKKTLGLGTSRLPGSASKGWQENGSV